MQFELKQDHITLLQNAFWQTSDYETGAPEIDGKRPYGNSYVPGDVADILGWKLDEETGLTEEQEIEALKLHHETLAAIQIILSTKSFKLGIYTSKQKPKDPYGIPIWVKK